MSGGPSTVSVPSAPGYEVTRDGRVFSVASNWRGKGRFQLVPDRNSHGYARVRLTTGDRRKVFILHVLVAKAFLPERPSAQHEVRHLDGDKSNNAAENLCWGTRAENAADRERHGHTSRGAKHGARIRAGWMARRERMTALARVEGK
jgi:hypothetical protein